MMLQIPQYAILIDEHLLNQHISYWVAYWRPIIYYFRYIF